MKPRYGEIGRDLHRFRSIHLAWFEDLSPCNYFGDEFTMSLRAVGWLERGQPFVSANRDEQVFRKLTKFCKDPWQPSLFRGIHDCDLCTYEPGAKGYSNVFIPGGSFLYVCPELIVHYMNAHGYGPPQEFCDAVLQCPPMRSIDYHKALLASGGRVLVKKYRDSE